MQTLPLGFEIARDIVSQYANSDVYFAGVGAGGVIPKQDNLDLCMETFCVMAFQLNFAMNLSRSRDTDNKIKNMLFQGEGIIVQYSKELGFTAVDEERIRATFRSLQQRRFKDYQALGKDAFLECRLKYYEYLVDIVKRNPKASPQAALGNADFMVVEMGKHLIENHSAFLQ